MSERHGSFAALPLEEPYEGLRRRTFDADGATFNEYTFDPARGSLSTAIPTSRSRSSRRARSS